VLLILWGLQALQEGERPEFEEVVVRRKPKIPLKSRLAFPHPLLMGAVMAWDGERYDFAGSRNRPAAVVLLSGGRGAMG
jgi:hypothetical protein